MFRAGVNKTIHSVRTTLGSGHVEPDFFSKSP